MTDETLAQKIVNASIEVGSLAADKRNKEQNYDYISADQILQKAGDALAKNGVVIFPAVISTDVKVTERQGKTPRIDAQVTFTMTVTDGKEKMECGWTGWGSDYATPDKAVYKAITSGHKYFEMKLLNIGIGNEDGEHEVETGQQKQSSQRLPVESKQPAPMRKPNEIITDGEWEAFGKLVQQATNANIKLPEYDRAKMHPASLNGAKKYIEQELSKKAGK